jgi:MATE family multidrug resistance protein
MLSNISQPLLGLIDIAVIGHLSDSRYLAAVAIGSTVFSFVYWSFGFLRMGTTGVVAQTVGAKDDSANKTVFAQSLLLALLIALCLVLFQTVIIDTAMTLLAPQANVLPHAQEYAQIRIYGAPAVLCNYVLLGWFVGNQNTKVLLLLLVSTNLLNIVLDIIAVVGLDMRVEGLAYATVISEYSGLLMACFFARKHLSKLAGKVYLKVLLSLSSYLPIIKVNQYLFVRTISLLLAMSFFTAQGAKLGADVLACNAVLMTFVMLISHVLDGFAHALEALVGKSIGERNLTTFFEMFSAASVCAILVAIAFSFTFWLLGESFINLLTSIEAVRENAYLYLPWLILIPLIAVTSYLLDGVFIGATQAKVMQNAMLVSVFCVYFPVWYFSQSLANNGLWLSLCALYVARAITSIYGFYKISANRRWL